MAHSALQLPPGCRYAFFDDIDTTNGEALRRALAGEQGGLWIWANRQSAGRGRIGRSWASPPGNLYASVLLRPPCPLSVAVGLSLLAGVAMYDAVEALSGERFAQGRLRLKWPNDLLLDGLKVGGVLLESAKSRKTGESAVVIGAGVNLVSHPDDCLRPATDLAARGVVASPSAAFAALAWATADWLGVWQNGKGFPQVRRAWIERAQGIGSEIAVRVGAEIIRGVFLGVDEGGALLLDSGEGAKRRITAGDVFFGAQA
jgi:BirA family biotin operon repressor/biotin-[acetyl-CoA-carboxylase] ligase